MNPTSKSKIDLLKGQKSKNRLPGNATSYTIDQN